jgi:pimeloyl-ACP methyl ester carboxylesterase
MTAVTLDADGQALDVWGGRVRLRVQTAGSGAPIVYLHAAAGFAFDPFLAALAADHRIYAPEVPGTSHGDPFAVNHVDDIHDLVLLYEEAIRGLGLAAPPVVIGQSFGGMLAAELASHYPALFSKVVLLAPVGLWREDLPIADWMTMPPAALPSLLFKDPGCPAAVAMFTPPDDAEQLVAAQSGFVWTLGCTGKFVWPIPDRGLRKRLHRLSAPALIVWGADDALVPAGYAAEFGSAIKGSRVEVLANCGHIPQLEQGDTTLRLVREFLA